MIDQIRIRLWDGSYWPKEKEAQATLVLNHSIALRGMLYSGTEVGMAEAYLYNDVDIEGIMESIFDLEDRINFEADSLGKKYHLLKLLK